MPIILKGFYPRKNSKFYFFFQKNLVSFVLGFHFFFFFLVTIYSPYIQVKLMCNRSISLLQLLVFNLFRYCFVVDIENMKTPHHCNHPSCIQVSSLVQMSQIQYDLNFLLSFYMAALRDEMFMQGSPLLKTFFYFIWGVSITAILNQTLFLLICTLVLKRCLVLLLRANIIFVSIYEF